MRLPKSLTLTPLLLLLVLGGCDQNPPTTVEVVESEPRFEFEFSYGMGQVPNGFSSFNDKFTKDMITADPITATMVLTEEEMRAVQNKIQELNLFESTPESDPGLAMQPCSQYSLYVESSELTDEVKWDDCNALTGSFKEFVDFMVPLLQSQEEYKALPEAVGGYM